MNSYCLYINHALSSPFQFHSHHHLPASISNRDNPYLSNFLLAFSLSVRKQLILIFWLVFLHHHLPQYTLIFSLHYTFLVANNRPSNDIYTSTIVFPVCIYNIGECRKESFFTYNTGWYLSKILTQITIKLFSLL